MVVLDETKSIQIEVPRSSNEPPPVPVRQRKPLLRQRVPQNIAASATTIKPVVHLSQKFKKFGRSTTFKPAADFIVTTTEADSGDENLDKYVDDEVLPTNEKEDDA